MLTKWKLFNFKAIQQETELEFKPLTIFAGANSSGKSTVLQSILLVAQTLGSRVVHRPIVLNGDLVKLGQFDDLKSQNGEAKDITVGWVLEPLESQTAQLRRPSSLPALRYLYEREDMVRQTTCDISFDAISGSAKKEVLQLQPALTSLNLRASIRGADGETRQTSMILSPKPLSDDGGNIEPTDAASPRLRRMEESDLSVRFDKQTEERQQVLWYPHENERVILKHFLPSEILGKFDATQVTVEAIMRALSGDARYSVSRSAFPHLAEIEIELPILSVIQNHLVEEHPLAEWLIHQIARGRKDIKLQEIEGYNRRNRLAQQPRVKPVKDLRGLRRDLTNLLSTDSKRAVFRRTVPLSDDLEEACKFTRNWFSTRVKYLGPLRDEPKSLYPLVSNVDPGDVGLRGEHTAAVYHIHRDNVVEHLSPENFHSHRIGQVRSRRSLNFAVSEWLAYLGVATSLKTEDRGKTGHEMQVCLHDGDNPHDLTHVGVGVSQVLPIVISCLLAEPDTLLIFEQPELHLHPKVQTLLADFFLAMGMLGKQCILETHSEYMINRLRFRAAAAEGRQVVQTMQIYFVKKVGDQATFEEVEVNEYGAILEWPEGFFDQSQREAEQTLKAAFAKKREERSRQ